MANNQDFPRFHIPENITRDHVILALREIDANGYSEKNASRKYDLLDNGKRYPPKVVISLANKFANGSVLDVSEFSGGEQFTNKFLNEKGFQIVPKIEEDYEYESYSWKIVGNVEAIKKMDRSSFLHHGTGIPHQIRTFFGIIELKAGEKKPILLWYQNNRFEANIEMTTLGSPRSRMLWRSDFSSIIQSMFPKWFGFFHAGGVESEDTPSLKFMKRPVQNEYEVEFIEDTPTEKRSQDEVILRKYQDYSRKEVHEIFDKNSHFTPQSGTWGLRGIISHPLNSNDFIFFVTFGHKEGTFAFEESVTESGILTWQSEPKQKIRDSVIQKLIHHDYRKNSIQLFLRTDRNRNYKYLGQLAYVTHDNEREEPVHFKWQILDWELDEIQAQEMGLTLIPDSPAREEVPQERDSLIQTRPPEQVAIPLSVGEGSRDFIAKKVDFVENEQKNKAVGLAGEELVLEYEIKTLEKNGYSHITRLIEHVSKIQGDGAGYDIKSIDTNLQPKFIEVKTTVGGINTPFTMTINELNFSQLHKEKYSLYRVYDFDKKSKTGKFYIIHGDISEKLVLEPTQFNCRPRLKRPEIVY
jgi:hypothetical protein